MQEASALRMARRPSLQEGGVAVGMNYILEVVEQVGDGFALRVGQDIIIVDF